MTHGVEMQRTSARAFSAASNSSICEDFQILRARAGPPGETGVLRPRAAAELFSREGLGTISDTDYDIRVARAD